MTFGAETIFEFPPDKNWHLISANKAQIAFDVLLEAFEIHLDETNVFMDTMSSSKIERLILEILLKSTRITKLTILL